MASKYTLCDKRRWPGVYYYESGKRKIRGKPDVCYVINYRLDGKLKWEKVGWKSEKYTPQIAAELRAERLQKARHGDAVKTHKDIREEKARTNRTLDEIATAYFEAKKEALRGESHRIDLGRYRRHVSPVLGDRRVSSLGQLDVERIKKNMGELSITSQWAALEIMRRVINYGVKVHMCPRLSFVIEMPKKDNEVVEYLEPEQMARLVEVLEAWPSQDIARMLQLALFTGMRRGEIFRLEDRDIDFKQSLITLRSPKGGKTVSIPLNGAARSVLEAQLDYRNEAQPDSVFVFPGANGAMRQNCTPVTRIKKAAELPKSFRIFHGLRHHFAVTLANSGEFSLDMIGQLLTHKSAAMTKRYAQFLPDTVKSASDRAAALLQSQAVQPKKTVKIKRKSG